MSVYEFIKNRAGEEEKQTWKTTGGCPKIMKPISLVCILLFLLLSFSMAQASEKGSVADLNLDALRWKNRVLVIFSPSESDVSFRLQKQGLACSAEGVLERDLMILEIIEQGQSRAENQLLSEKSVRDIRKRFGLQTGTFQVLLIGKDGGVKLRSSEPVSMKDLFGLIDSMPMRRQEMDSKKK
jgi:hypothetical protein